MKINQFLLIAICLFAFQVHAGQDRGGGSYVVIDGKVTIADPYYAGRSAGQADKITLISYKDFPEKIRAYISQTQRLFSPLLSSFEVERFFENYVKNEKQRYFLVPKSREENIPCEKYLPILSRNVDEHFQFGCTFGQDTYLFVDKWAKAPIEEQALALIHERLWAWTEDRLDKNIDQKIIADFITWTQVLENRYIKQVLNDDRTPMPPEEIAGMRIFFKAAQQLGFRESDCKNCLIVSSGGIISSSTYITIENSFLGFGTYIFVQKTSEDFIPSIRIKNSTILNTILGTMKTCDVTDSTTIDSNLIVNSLIRSNVINSDISTSPLIRDSSFANASLYGNGIDFSDSQFNHSNIQNSKMYINGGHDDYWMLNFTDINESDTFGSIVANGLENSRTKILGSKINNTSTSIEAGSMLDKTNMQELGSVSVGSENILRNLHFKGSRKTDVIVEKKTLIANGIVKFTNGCFGSKKTNRSRFYLGNKKEPSQINLNNTTLDLETSGFSCSTRYDP